MEATRVLTKNASIYGWLWVAISPTLAGMALISTVSSDITYWAQVVAFCTVASVGLAAGVGMIFRRIWGAKVLLALSWLGCVYWFGSALLGATFAVIAAKASLFVIAALAVAIGLPGVAFLLLARGIRRQLSVAGAPSNHSSKPTPLRGAA